jgi:protein-S-isoprenylcysteine O-methyltransferase Ste14
MFRFRGDQQPGILSDNWTFPVIFASYVFVIMAGLAEFFYWSPKVNPWLSGAGYLLATAGVITTRRCVLALGVYWSIRIVIQKDHRVVDKGPYRFCRHPYYLATLLN